MGDCEPLAPPSCNQTAPVSCAKSSMLPATAAQDGKCAQLLINKPLQKGHACRDRYKQFIHRYQAGGR